MTLSIICADGISQLSLSLIYEYLYIGSLVGVGSAYENGLIYSEVSKGALPVWLGLRLSEDGTSFTWADGSPFGYTNWYTGEPNNGGGFGAEECGQMYQNSGFWNDFSCDTSYGYVCQIDKRRRLLMLCTYITVVRLFLLSF
jgi:hypothetical protein